MAFESINNIKTILYSVSFLVLALMQGVGESDKGKNPIVKERGKPGELDRPTSAGEQLNLNHAIRLESHPRRKGILQFV